MPTQYRFRIDHYLKELQNPMNYKRKLRSAWHRLGLAIHRTDHLNRFLKHHEVDLLVDVGANHGQFGREMRDRGYKGRMLSFEPVSSVFAELERESAGDPLWETRHSAIGAEPGTAEINVSEFTVFSSIKSINQEGLEFCDRARPVRTETVEVRRLDDVLSDHPAQRIFLKIDTQGFEREVLLGADAVLSRCVGVQLELPAQHIYDSLWSMHEAIGFMDDRQFVPAQFEMVNAMKDDPTSGLEFDCVFRRK